MTTERETRWVVETSDDGGKTWNYSQSVPGGYDRALEFVRVGRAMLPDTQRRLVMVTVTTTEEREVVG